jgi:hypothetical protein
MTTNEVIDMQSSAIDMQAEIIKRQSALIQKLGIALNLDLEYNDEVRHIEKLKKMVKNKDREGSYGL